MFFDFSAVALLLTRLKPLYANRWNTESLWHQRKDSNSEYNHYLSQLCHFSLFVTTDIPTDVQTELKCNFNMPVYIYWLILGTRALSDQFCIATNGRHALGARSKCREEDGLPFLYQQGPEEGEGGGGDNERGGLFPEGATRTTLETGEQQGVGELQVLLQLLGLTDIPLVAVFYPSAAENVNVSHTPICVGGTGTPPH